MVAAIVNDEYVPVDYRLTNKDRVRIVTDSLSYGPREDWVEKAQTNYVKRKIKEFNKKDFEFIETSLKKLIKKEEVFV